jgi:RNA polymerase sigma-70 factor (ECF subfamily)
MGRQVEAAQLLSRGRAAYPKLDVPGPVFERALRAAIQGEWEDAGRLEEFPAEDLYLACACAEGLRGAAEEFERQFGATLRRAVARVLSDAGERDEAVQRTRDHLLVARPGEAARIAAYRGEGPLSHWVSVAAVRIAVSSARAASAELRLRRKAESEAAGVDAELLFMKAELRQEFKAAVESALERLEDRTRLVLRLYLVSGMSLSAIGNSFGVTQQAVSKWLATARANILSDVQRTFEQQLKVHRDELTSMVPLIASCLDVSISRILHRA